MFWVDEWLPQIEVLANPITKVGITHCGLGGIFEFMHCGVVPLGFPHFGDQGPNAQNLIDSGAGLSLFRPKDAERIIMDELNFYKDPKFTAKDVKDKLKELLTNPKYELNLMKMKCAAIAAGGG